MRLSRSSSGELVRSDLEEAAMGGKGVPDAMTGRPPAATPENAGEMLEGISRSDSGRRS
jgi:hypothetical protein